MTQEDIARFDQNTFAVFTRWWIEGNKLSEIEAAQRLSMTPALLQELLTGEILPAKVTSVIKNYARVLQIDEGLSEAIIVGRRDIVLAHLKQCAQMAMRR